MSEILAPLEVSDKAQAILIEGSPGVGKTILLKHIACTVGLSKECYKNTTLYC